MKAASKYALLFLAFTPLIVDHLVFFPFITGKALFIRGLVALAGLLLFMEMFRSEAFRGEIGEKFRRLCRNPVFLSVAAFLLVLIISTITALNSFRAFYGDVERGEGFIGMAAFLGFFFLSLLLFEKKEWIRFFKLTLLSGGILFIHELIQLFSGETRPSSLTGNPIYLAAYFLFVIASAVLVARDAKSASAVSWADSFWKWLGLFMVPLSVIGIFLTQTRGVILGLILGVLGILLWGVLRGREIYVFSGADVRKISLYFLGFLVIGGAIFGLSREANFWQDIPGLDRLARFTLQDGTAQTRLISLGVSMKALSPAQNGWGRFFFGWGLENFSIAYNKHYNPEYFQYEQSWFDRAHNKLMDVLVMNGIFGLLAYLAMWGSFFWLALKKARAFHEQATLLFLGVAYFVQNLFVFDSVSTYIPFFAFFAFAGRDRSDDGKETTAADSAYIKYGAPAAVGIFAIFSVYSLLAHTLPAYFQMRRYVSFTQHENNAMTLLEDFSDLLSPYTYAQENIRNNFLNGMRGIFQNDRRAEPLFLAGLSAMEELIEKEPYSPRHLMLVGQSYDTYAGIKEDPQLHKKAEEYLSRALALAPDRQDVRYIVAINLSHQKRHGEAVAMLKEVLSDNPNVARSRFYLAIVLARSGESGYAEAFDNFEESFKRGFYSENMDVAFGFYYRFLDNFVKNRDKDNALKAVRRLMEGKIEDRGELQKMENLIETEQWGKINIVFE